MSGHLCEVCRDRLSLGELFQAWRRREPLACTYDTASGQERSVEARFVCGACVHQYGRRVGAAKSRGRASGS